MDREIEALWEVGTRVWSTARDASRTGLDGEDAGLMDEPGGAEAVGLQREYLRLVLTLAAEQAILRLRGWKEEAWPPWAHSALNDPLAALAEATGERYRIRGWRLERAMTACGGDCRGGGLLVGESPERHGEQ